METYVIKLQLIASLFFLLLTLYNVCRCLSRVDVRFSLLWSVLSLTAAAAVFFPIDDGDSVVRGIVKGALIVCIIDSLCAILFSGIAIVKIYRAFYKETYFRTENKVRSWIKIHRQDMKGKGIDMTIWTDENGEHSWAVCKEGDTYDNPSLFLHINGTILPERPKGSDYYENIGTKGISINGYEGKLRRANEIAGVWSPGPLEIVPIWKRKPKNSK